MATKCVSNFPFHIELPLELPYDISGGGFWLLKSSKFHVLLGGDLIADYRVCCSDLDIDIEDNGDGTFTVYYTVKDAGDYTLSVKFGGQPVPGGFYTFTVSTPTMTRPLAMMRGLVERHRVLYLDDRAFLKDAACF